MKVVSWQCTARKPNKSEGQTPTWRAKSDLGLATGSSEAHGEKKKIGYSSCPSPKYRLIYAGIDEGGSLKQPHTCPGRGSLGPELCTEPKSSGKKCQVTLRYSREAGGKGKNKSCRHPRPRRAGTCKPCLEELLGCKGEGLRRAKAWGWSVENVFMFSSGGKKKNCRTPQDGKGRED